MSTQHGSVREYRFFQGAALGSSSYRGHGSDSCALAGNGQQKVPVEHLDARERQLTESIASGSRGFSG